MDWRQTDPGDQLLESRVIAGIADTFHHSAASLVNQQTSTAAVHLPEPQLRTPNRFGDILQELRSPGAIHDPVVARKR